MKEVDGSENRVFDSRRVHIFFFALFVGVLSIWEWKVGECEGWGERMAGLFGDMSLLVESASAWSRMMVSLFALILTNTPVLNVGCVDQRCCVVAVFVDVDFAHCVAAHRPA